MNALLDALADRRLLVYAGGLLAIVGVRALSPSTAIRIGVVSLVLSVMGVTYVGERVAGGGAVDRPLLVLAGLGGIAAGSALALSGRIGGVVFVLGGLLFLHGGTTGGERG